MHLSILSREHTHIFVPKAWHSSFVIINEQIPNYKQPQNLPTKNWHTSNFATLVILYLTPTMRQQNFPARHKNELSTYARTHKTPYWNDSSKKKIIDPDEPMINSSKYIYYFFWNCHFNKGIFTPNLIWKTNFKCT